MSSTRFTYADDNFGPRVRDMKTGRWMGVDLVKEMASVIPAATQPDAAEVPALKSARDTGFNAGTVAALAILRVHDSETQWHEVLQAAGAAEVLYYAAHIEPDDWQWGGFAQYKMTKPKKNRANKKD